LSHQSSSASPLPDLSKLLELAREAVIATKLDGTVVAWNPSAEEIYGYSAHEVIGQRLSILAPAGKSMEFSSLIERINRGETIDSLEVCQVRKGGREIDVSLRISPIRTPTGEITGVLWLAAGIPDRDALERAERNERFFSSVVSSADEAIMSKDVNGLVTTWNPGAERIFGYTAQEMIGKPMSILLTPDHPDEEQQILDRVRHGERIEHYETQRKRKDGRVIDVSITILPIRDGMGRVIGAASVARDIRERKRLEKAERDQLFLAAIISSAEDAIISKDVQGIVTSWNRAAEKIFGYKADEMIGQSITKIIPPDHPEEESQILERIRHGERIEHYESKRTRKDGKIIDVSLTISPIKDEMRRVVGASTIAQDITQRKRWQKAEVDQSFLAALVESADDAIIGKDLDGTVTSWNAAAEKLYGYTAQEMMGKPIALLIPAEYADQEPKILERIRRGERIQHYETQRVRKDGTIIDVSLTVSPIRDSLGRIIGASKISRDITAKKRAEAREREILRETQQAKTQAEQARQQAERASRAKDEFLATVSHELRTPMTAMMGWSRMLLTGQLSPERQRKAFETIDRNARSQAQLIEDLLDISRIIAGQLRIEFKNVDMPSVVSAAVEALRPTAEAKKIAVDFAVTSGAGPIVGDAERLQQVVWNLLSNAIKFTPRGGRIQVDLRRVESQVELRVTDNGMGIDPEYLPHVFERFSQADSSITRNSGGLGMGLAIVKSLIELHGGVVLAESAGEGKGSVFTVKLPVSAIREDAIRPRALPKPTLQAELRLRDELVGLKILIVDDEPDTCELLRFVFNECGAIVETAHNTKTALELFDDWHPDILISDIGMPEVDGYQFIRTIREDRGCRIPAVALTAMARVEDRMRALTAGYQMHVAKPVEPIELITIVTSIVGLVDRPPTL
jgi:PAS domain S-box-containing protein